MPSALLSVADGTEILGRASKLVCDELNSAIERPARNETSPDAITELAASFSRSEAVSVVAEANGIANMLPIIAKFGAEEHQGGSLVFHTTSVGALAEVTANGPSSKAVLVSSSAQEAHDMAIVAQCASAASGASFIHVLAGNRALHAVASVAVVGENELRSALAASPPRGPAPAVGPSAVASVVEETMANLKGVLGRDYAPIEFVGPADAEFVVVAMGSSAQTAIEALLPRQSVPGTGMSSSAGVGVLHVRLLRPFSAAHLRRVLPRSVSRVLVIEEGGEDDAPALFADVLAAWYAIASQIVP